MTQVNPTPLPGAIAVDFVKKSIGGYATMELKLAIGGVGVLVGLVALLVTQRLRQTKPDRDRSKAVLPQDDKLRDHMAFAKTLKRPGLCGPLGLVSPSLAYAGSILWPSGGVAADSQIEGGSACGPLIKLWCVAADLVPVGL